MRLFNLVMGLVGSSWCVALGRLAAYSALRGKVELAGVFLALLVGCCIVSAEVLARSLFGEDGDQ